MKTRILIISLLMFVTLFSFADTTSANWSMFNSFKNISQSFLGYNHTGSYLGELSETEKNNLLYNYQEERLARDIYTELGNLYDNQVFDMIANSEQKHMDAVERVLSRYSIDVPTGYGELDTLYQELLTKGSLSLKDALEVGMTIEIKDIDDIVEQAISVEENDDILRMYTNIGGASYMHLSHFIRELENNGFTTEIDYSNYLTPDTHPRDLKNSIVDKMQEVGVDVPYFNKRGGRDCDNGFGDFRKGGRR